MPNLQKISGDGSDGAWRCEACVPETKPEPEDELYRAKRPRSDVAISSGHGTCWNCNFCPHSHAMVRILTADQIAQSVFTVLAAFPWETLTMSLRLSSPLPPNLLHPSFRQSETSIEDPFQLDYNISQCPRSMLISAAQAALGAHPTISIGLPATSQAKTLPPTQLGLQNVVSLPVDLATARQKLFESLVALEFSQTGDSNRYSIEDESCVSVVARNVTWSGGRKKHKEHTTHGRGQALFKAAIRLSERGPSSTDITISTGPDSEREHYQLFFAVIKRMLLAPAK